MAAVEMTLTRIPEATVEMLIHRPTPDKSGSYLAFTFRVAVRGSRRGGLTHTPAAAGGHTTKGQTALDR